MSAVTLVAVIMVGIMVISLLLGVPMAIGMAFGALFCMITIFPDVNIAIALQQMYVGLNSYVLLAVPMFMLAAEIMCVGQCADRLLRLVRAFLGHVPGGTAITSIGTCTLFGAISGSTQATFVAIGRPMFKELSNTGYGESHSLAMLMSAATIALLIPPSISMVIYCVVANCSIGEMFIAGIGPGLFVCLAFCVYEFIYAKRHKDISRFQRASAKELLIAVKEALLPLMFPVIILGGIYTGTFSPTEAAAVSVAYALVLELVIYRSLTLKHIINILIDIGLVTATVFILVGAGQIMSWVLSYAGIPQAMAAAITDMGLGRNGFMLLVSAFFFIACMFMDATPVMYILVPIFAPISNSLGIDPILLGLLIVLQSAIGCITPPFGYNIFTAMAIFDKPYTLVVRKLAPYLIMSVAITVTLILFPNITLFLRDLAFSK